LEPPDFVGDVHDTYLSLFFYRFYSLHRIRAALIADIASISYKMLSPVPSNILQEIFLRFAFCPKFYMSLSKNAHVTYSVM